MATGSRDQRLVLRLLILISVLGLVAVIFRLWAGPGVDGEITFEQYSQLELGMTIDEAEQIVGPLPAEVRDDEKNRVVVRWRMGSCTAYAQGNRTKSFAWNYWQDR